MVIVLHVVGGGGGGRRPCFVSGGGWEGRHAKRAGGAHKVNHIILRLICNKFYYI